LPSKPRNGKNLSLNKLKYSIFIWVLLSSTSLWAEETCSRVAVVNYQEVLVDTNSTEKGEGLRYYLDKDVVAKSYLNRYQKGTKIKWYSAVAGSLGTGMMLGGLLTNSNTNNKKALLLGGAGVILINFLVSRTLENANENNLLKAVEEYNKRNLPRIYFSPEEKDDKRTSWKPTISFSKVWYF
jgi:hypothetical protein